MKERSEILSLSNLSIGYVSGKSRKIILPPLNAKAFRGELIAMIGQNGVGKSTLLRTITGLQEPLGGTVMVDEKTIAGYTRTEFAQRLGFISTEPVRVSNMKVFDLVALGRYPHTNWLGKLKNEDHDIIMDSIEKVAMKSFTDRYITELSDGERQRVMIARVLAQDTDLLVMDEPTAFLDIKSKYEIVHLLHDLSKNRGKTIIFSTHDLNIAVSEADKVWLILEDAFKEGAPEDLIIGGSFDELFRKSLVRFNSEDGSFTFRNEFKGEIFVEGKGLVKIWTEKAINRAGYSVSEKKCEINIGILAITDGNEWIVEKNQIKTGFTSLYDLVAWLTAQSE